MAALIVFPNRQSHPLRPPLPPPIAPPLVLPFGPPLAPPPHPSKCVSNPLRRIGRHLAQRLTIVFSESLVTYSDHVEVVYHPESPTRGRARLSTAEPCPTPTERGGAQRTKAPLSAPGNGEQGLKAPPHDTM